MTGAQSRSDPVALSARPPMRTTVAKKLNGAPDTGPLSGAPESRPATNGITVNGMSMITVPDTAGVRIRWKRDNLQESRSGTSADTVTSVASRAGPPSPSAMIEAGMKAPEVPMTMTCPAPMRPARNA